MSPINQLLVLEKTLNSMEEGRQKVSPSDIENIYNKYGLSENQKI